MLILTGIGSRQYAEVGTNLETQFISFLFRFRISYKPIKRMNGSSSSTRQYSLSLQLNGSIVWKESFFKIERDAHGFIFKTEANSRCLILSQFKVRARTTCGLKLNQEKSKAKILVEALEASGMPSSRHIAVEITDQRPTLCEHSPVQYLAVGSRRSV